MAANEKETIWRRRLVLALAHGTMTSRTTAFDASRWLFGLTPPKECCNGSERQATPFGASIRQLPLPR